MIDTSFNILSEENINELKLKLLQVLKKTLSDYIIIKGYWGNSQIVINDLTNQTIETIIKKNIDCSSCLENKTKLKKLAKQICNEKIKQQLKNTSSISEIKNLLKLNINDEEKLTTLIKLKLAKNDKAAGTNFEEKLMKHETQMAKYGLTINDAYYIEKAFLDFSRKKSKSLIVIDECQYLFALYFGYNLNHKQIVEFENTHLLKINNTRKSIQKLSTCLRSIFSHAKLLKYKNNG